MSKKVLKIKTYKIPIERDGDEIKEIQKPLTEEDLLDTEEITIEDIQKDIPEQTKNVAQYNARQVTYAKNDLTMDYIKKRIITK